MFRKALLGLWVTCVCATLSTTGTFAAAADIVLYAGDATNLRGNWSRGADTSAAGGQVLTSADKGLSNTGGPLASPTDSFDFTFTAPAATTYHMWVRMRAAGNSKYNDSVFAQFSDAVDLNGSALFTVGTKNGLTLNLAGDATAKSLNGWGWQDRAYWLTQPTTIRFATSGAHILRLQTREDGVQIDQVVLSPVTYFTSAPGPLSNDAAIVPKTAATVPAPWTSRDVGATGVAGTSAYATGVFSVAGAGADIWGTADGFRFLSQPVSGDVQMVARVASLRNTNANAKAGVMLRETSAAGSGHVLIDMRPDGSIEFMTRTATGASTVFLTGGSQPLPAWLKLARIGATVTAAVSSDGSAWTTIGSTPATLAATAMMGLAVTSHDATQLNTSTFDNVLLTVPPTAPAFPTPAAGATSVATNASLAWSASGATSYDVSLGTTNPPATVATGVTTASYTPASLSNGTTYYWQVVARNAGVATAGPLSSFTTIVAPPTSPTAVAPANGATGVATNASLAWSASGATSYDVSFGATNPPATVATGVTTASYTPARLSNSATYYWQVTAHNDGGATAGSVSSFTTVAAPVATATNIVLYAADASKVQGNWALVADTTAAGGYTLSSTDKGWSNAAGPSATPADSFEMTFTAPAATAYHLWFRMRAVANSKYNDSVFSQFSDAVDGNGAAIYGLGTTSGLVVNQATDSTASSLSGWGWQDGAYWLIQTTTIKFAADFTHTLRVQTREDGVSIDQIVLSPMTYLTAAPGVATNDTTIVPKTAPAPTPMLTPAPAPTPIPTSPPTPTALGAPAAYNAITDRNAYTKPALPLLGAAGYSFNDPTFGSKMLRVTDGRTRPGLSNRSYRVPSNAHLAAWNATSTAFFVVSNDGTSIPFAFDPATMTASRIQPASSGNGGLTLAFYVEPQFSIVNPKVIYGAVSGSNNHTIAQYDFSTGTYTTVVDLDTIAGGLSGTYVGGLMTGGTPSENLMTFFGGASQDNHYFALWSPIGNLAGRKLMNTVNSTINGSAMSAVLNFHLHSVQIDKSGRFVFLYPTSVDLGAPRYASQVYVWDTASDTVTAITSGGKDGSVNMHSSGHDAAGYGYWVNQDCCTSSSWDAAQWQFRSLTSLAQTSDLISPVLATKEVYLADHTTWNNAQPSTLVPVISSTYRYGDNTTAWRAWDDEIIGIDTTGGIGGIVYRFAHHRSNVGSDANPLQPYFWYQPIANISPDGKWVLFTSNWEKTLGTDSSEGTFRQDVFIVQLTPR